MFTQDRSPAVTALPVHLPQEQRVLFNPADPQRALDQAERTMLTAFFELNRDDPAARDHKYMDIPRYYTWQQPRKVWQKRKSQVTDTPANIGRVHNVHPNQGETFYLRLLLHHKTGPTSFSDLRTVEGEECATYKEACLRMHLLEDDTEWMACLTEAAQTSMPSALRALFVTVLTFCEPSEPLNLFEQHKNSLGDDFKRKRHRQGISENAIEKAALNDVLCDLNNRLQQHGYTTVDFGLPVADYRQQHQLDLSADQMDPDAGTTFELHHGHLNTEQAEVFAVVKAKIDQDEGGVVFIDAPGKIPFLINFGMCVSFQ